MNRIARTRFPEDGSTTEKWQPLVVMDDEDAARSDYQEAARRLIEFDDRRDMFICGGKTAEDRLMRYDATLLALGRHHIPAHKTAAAVGREHGVSSARITALVKRFQTYMKLPPMNGQNTDEQRENKSTSRRNTLE